MDACQAALLRGSPDEFALLRRKGILLQSFDKPEQALDAFIAANVLKQDDKSVALAIVALTDSTGRRDALALAARGSSLLTLHRASEALQAFAKRRRSRRRCRKSRTQIAQAEQAAREESKRRRRGLSQCAADQDTAAAVPSAGRRSSGRLGAVTYSNDAALLRRALTSQALGSDAACGRRR